MEPKSKSKLNPDQIVDYLAQGARIYIAKTRWGYNLRLRHKGKHIWSTKYDPEVYNQLKTRVAAKGLDLKSAFARVESYIREKMPSAAPKPEQPKPPEQKPQPQPSQQIQTITLEFTSDQMSLINDLISWLKIHGSKVSFNLPFRLDLEIPQNLDPRGFIILAMNVLHQLIRQQILTSRLTL